MSAKHTPGPWEIGNVEADGLGRYAFIQSSEDFGDIVGRVCVSHKANRTLNESGQANARLIAAAPELLEALIEASEWVSEYVSQMSAYTISDEADESLRRVRDAIAKATGEQA